MKITLKELEEKLSEKLTVYNLIKLIYKKEDEDDILAECGLITQEETEEIDYNPLEWIRKNICPFEEVYSERSEGSGDYDGWDIVIKFGDDLFLMICAGYSSYGGLEFYSNEVHQVKGVEKIVKIWEIIETF